MRAASSRALPGAGATQMPRHTTGDHFAAPLRGVASLWRGRAPHSQRRPGYRFAHAWAACASLISVAQRPAPAGRGQRPFGLRPHAPPGAAKGGMKENQGFLSRQSLCVKTVGTQFQPRTKTSTRKSRKGLRSSDGPPRAVSPRRALTGPRARAGAAYASQAPRLTAPHGVRHTSVAIMPERPGAPHRTRSAPLGGLSPTRCAQDRLRGPSFA